MSDQTNLLKAMDAMLGGEMKLYTCSICGHQYMTSLDLQSQDEVDKNCSGAMRLRYFGTRHGK